MSNTNETDEEITLKEVIINLQKATQYLLSKWKFILIAATFGAVYGYYLSITKEEIFTAKCTFVVDGGSSPMPGGAGLASLMGIDIQGSPGMFQSQNILALYESRLMIEKTLFTYVKSSKGKPVLLIDRWLQFTKSAKDWSSIPDSKKPEILKSVTNTIAKSNLKIETEDLITVTLKAQDEFFAKEFTESLVDNVNKFYIETKLRRSLDALRVFQGQADSLRVVLNNSMAGAASAIDANPNANPALQILRVPSQRKQVDVQSTSAIYLEVVKNIETTKMALRREMPLIQVVDKPFYPLDKEVSNKPIYILVGALLASFLVVLTLIFTKLFQRVMSVN